MPEQLLRAPGPDGTKCDIDEITSNPGSSRDVANIAILHNNYYFNQNKPLYVNSIYLPVAFIIFTFHLNLAFFKFLLAWR